MEIKLRTFIFVLVLFVVILFAAVNWPLFTEASTLNLLFGAVVAPLGLVMLGVVGGLTVLFLLLLGTVEAGAMVGNRKTARELDETRKLALSAEESRLKELREDLQERLARIEDKVTDIQNQTAGDHLRHAPLREPTPASERISPTTGEI